MYTTALLSAAVALLGLATAAPILPASPTAAEAGVEVRGIPLGLLPLQDPYPTTAPKIAADGGVEVRAVPLGFPPLVDPLAVEAPAVARRDTDDDDEGFTIRTFLPTPTPARGVAVAERDTDDDEGFTIRTFLPTPTPARGVAVAKRDTDDDEGFTIRTFLPTPAPTRRIAVAERDVADDPDVTIHTFLPTTAPALGAATPSINVADGLMWPVGTPDPRERKDDGGGPTWSGADDDAGISEAAEGAEAEVLDHRLQIPWYGPLGTGPLVPLVDGPGPAVLVDRDCDIHWTDDRFCGDKKRDSTGGNAAADASASKKDTSVAEEAASSLVDFRPMAGVPRYYFDGVFQPICWPEARGPKPKGYEDLATCEWLKDHLPRPVLTLPPLSVDESLPAGTGPHAVEKRFDHSARMDHSARVLEAANVLQHSPHRKFCVSGRVETTNTTDAADTANIKHVRDLPSCSETARAFGEVGALLDIAMHGGMEGLRDFQKNLHAHVQSRRGHGPVCYAGSAESKPMGSKMMDCPQDGRDWW
ncbi:hypothetical protein B0A50_01687 [Salinomyces thailandicus]|uniref:Uncharacterized protein n=1 Tax=Salinomyces thailandicus TaxID=706561 RepID=A0A4U0U8J8_9PEZI|nr:hypothetical protein B0A50_01687 [Salinomyces thailandica]